MNKKMGRPVTYDTDAEKKAAMAKSAREYRARKKLAEAQPKPLVARLGAAVKTFKKGFKELLGAN